MTMYGALVGLAVPGLAAAALPPMEYRYASFGVPDPAATASFLLRFVNATRITDDPSLWLRADVAPASTLEALRLPYADGAAYSDVYLELDATLPPSGGVAQFADALEATHTMAQDDWDWWLDTHLAFSVADLDGVAARLLRANVPFVNRGSVYFVAPGGVVVQVLGEPSIYWTEPFLFCRRTADATTGAMRPYALNVTDVGALPAPAALPEFAPSHMSFAATAAKTSAFWAQRVLAFSEVVPAWDTHAWANGTCADIRWMEVASRWKSTSSSSSSSAGRRERREPRPSRARAAPVAIAGGSASRFGVPHGLRRRGRAAVRRARRGGRGVPADDRRRDRTARCCCWRRAATPSERTPLPAPTTARPPRARSAVPRRAPRRWGDEGRGGGASDSRRRIPRGARSRTWLTRACRAFRATKTPSPTTRSAAWRRSRSSTRGATPIAVASAEAGRDRGRALGSARARRGRRRRAALARPRGGTPARARRGPQRGVAHGRPSRAPRAPRPAGRRRFARARSPARAASSASRAAWRASSNRPRSRAQARLGRAFAAGRGPSTRRRRGRARVRGRPRRAPRSPCGTRPL